VSKKKILHKIFLLVGAAVIFHAVWLMVSDDFGMWGQDTWRRGRIVPPHTIATRIYLNGEEYVSPIAKLQIHWDDGVIKYGSKTEDNTLVLYEVEDGEKTRLAVFPTLNVERGYPETEWSMPPHIFDFDVVGDWIIVSVGKIQGSGRFFAGDIFRVKRDGSVRESFRTGSFEERFFIIDGWVYNFIWTPQEVCGWYRFSPCGTYREYMGDTVRHIITFAEDGFIYGRHMASGEDNLARWLPESHEPITLFYAENAPVFEEYSTSIRYGNITVIENYVYFSVAVYKWDIIGWNDVWIRLYAADYRVDKDGGNRTLLSEEFFTADISSPQP